MADIEGSYDELFTAVPSALAGLLDDGDAGASVAVFVDGEPVVDVWGGFADANRTIPWQRDTITNVWSVTKTMTALCALVLADRGELDLTAPVGRYWPEFAVAGKEKVLVRHLLGHTAGLPDWDGPVEDLYDWPSATARLAAQAPQWEPGSSRIPLAHPGVSRGRGRTPDHRPEPGRLLRRGGGRTAGCRLPHWAARRARPPGGAHGPAVILGRGLCRQRARQQRAPRRRHRYPRP
jgi:hypothetical protein